MLAIVLALLLLTNFVTYYVMHLRTKKTLHQLSSKAEESEQALATFKDENQTLRQELADLRYKNRELEKDLAAAKR